jgi:hypothetical protein
LRTYYLITKFLRIATFAVLTALTIGGNCLSSAQAAKTETSTANGGTAAGAKPVAPSAPVPAAAPSPAAPAPVPSPTKVDANTLSKEQAFTAHESQAPIMTPDERNALYFQWIGGFILITGSIIGFIIYKAMPPKPVANMSLEQASDAYDGPKKETTSAKVAEPVDEKKAQEAVPGGSETKEEPTASAETAPASEPDQPAPGAAETTGQSAETTDKATESTEPAPAPAEAASSDSESKA